MTGFGSAVLLWGAFGVCFTGIAFGSEFKIGQWPYAVPITIESLGGKKAVECALTPEVYDKARPDLADLRIATDDGQETGYVRRRAVGSRKDVPLNVTLYNRSHIVGKQSSITADFGSKVMKNRVSVKTPGTNFRRKVKIEAGDDGENWAVIRDGAYLFRVQEVEGKAGGFDKHLIEIPENNQRYLRITVFRGEDDPDVVDMEDVKASRQVRVTPETVDVPVISSKVEARKNRTDILLDLGFANLPLYSMELDFSDADFLRNVTVEGRNRETRVIRSRVEDAPALEKTVNEPWRQVTKAKIYRFSSGGAVEESLRVNLKGAHHRYLRIQIRNDDNPPLHFTGANVKRLVGKLSFPARAGARYALYIGNLDAKKPRYDVGHYLNRVPEQEVYTATLGRVEPNPAHRKAEKPIPWSERHKGIIWLALVAVLAVLGLLVYRVAVSPRGTG